MDSLKAWVELLMVLKLNWLMPKKKLMPNKVPVVMTDMN